MKESEQKPTFTLTINKSYRNPNYSDDSYRWNGRWMYNEQEPLILMEQVLSFTVTEDEFERIRNIVALGLVSSVKVKDMTLEEYEKSLKWTLPSA